MRWWGVLATYLSVVEGQLEEEKLLFEKGVLTDAAEISIFGGEGSLRQIVMHGGNQEGSLVLRVETPELVLYLSPSRGMNILNMTAKIGANQNMFVGWTNPVEGVVNPAYVNLMERDGSGFLQGFNEVVARCGYQWAGHAGYDGDEFLTLHGLMSNTPAYEVSYKEESTAISIYSKVRLATFKKSNFLVTSGLRIEKGSREVWIEDTLENGSDYVQEYMAIYHANFGRPILESASKVYVPAREVSPFNLNAVTDLENWNQMLEPTRGYDETVYNIFPYGDQSNWTVAVMANNAEDRGIGVRWRMTELPVFGLWKNLDTVNTGYVVGLEPGTSFSYNRRWNRDIGLVPLLAAGASVTFSTKFHPLVSQAEVKAYKDAVQEIQGDKPVTLRQVPLSLLGEGGSGSSSAASYVSLTVAGLLTYLVTMF